MKKILIILTILLPFIVNCQTIIKDSNGKIIISNNKIVTSPYRYITNSITSWTQSTGTYINGSADGRNYIQCTSSGAAYLESTQAYGIWEFDIYRYSNGYQYIDFISKGTRRSDGYELQFRNDGQFAFYRTSGGLITSTLTFTAVGYLPASGWLSVRIKRSIAGVFQVYIKGSSFGEKWVYVFGATDNTYATSDYFLIDIATNDKVSNVRFKKL